MRSVIILIPAAALLAAQQPDSASTMVRALGEATVSVHPDQARLRLAVITKGSTAERARAKNAERATELFSRLRDLLGQQADVRTMNYALTRHFPDGFEANNTIEVHLRGGAEAGRVIDTAAKSGAVVVSGIDEAAAQEPGARQEALRLATAAAQANAEAMAAALRLKVVRIVSAESSMPIAPPAPVPIDGRVVYKKAVKPTRVEPGSVEVRARVIVTLEAAP